MPTPGQRRTRTPLTSSVLLSKASTLTESLHRLLDYRLVLLGSMLPDIVDKPVSFLFFSYFRATRLFGHTLLFNLLLIALGVTLFLQVRRGGVLTLALASLAHLVEDQMWEEPATLFWPLLGFAFPTGEAERFVGVVRERLSDPLIYIPEIIGILILILAAILVWLVQQSHLEK